MNPGNLGKSGMLGIVESLTYGTHSRGLGTTLSSSTRYFIGNCCVSSRVHPFANCLEVWGIKRHPGPSGLDKGVEKSSLIHLPRTPPCQQIAASGTSGRPSSHVASRTS